MKTVAVINPRAGSVPEDGPRRLASVCAELGLRPEILAADPPELWHALDAAVAQGPERLIAWGGDGTLARALARVGPERPLFLPLPGGTMNLLARAVHGEPRGGEGTWDALLKAALAGGRTLALPCGRIDGERFFVAAIFGDLARLAESREALRSGELVQALRALIEHEPFDLGRPLTFRLGRRLGPRAAERWPAGFGDGEAAQGWGPPLRAVAVAVFVDRETGGFEIASIRPDTLLDVARMAVEALLWGWRDAEGVARHRARRVWVSAADGEPLAAILDGEIRELPGTCEIACEARAATVLTARSV